MKHGRPGRVIDWGHLALLAVIVGVVVAYLLDARATSLKTNNLLLLQPAAILALVLAAIVLPQCFRRRPLEEESQKAAPEDSRTTVVEGRGELLKVGLLAAAFGGLVFSLETVGFDVATFLFTAAGLFVCGERRLWVVGLYSALFTAAIIYGYQMLVPYPFPLSVL